MKIQNRVPLETSRPKESLDTKFKEVSKLYEKQFLREMVKAMRSTVHEGGFIQSNHAEKIFRDQLDNEYVETWGDQGGLGLSELIYQQLNEKFGQKSLQGRGFSKPHGPIPIEQESQFKIKTQQQGQGLQNQIQIKKNTIPEVSLKMPWSGFITQTYEVGGTSVGSSSQKVIEMEHDGGLKSRFLSSGIAVIQNPGERIQANEVFAKFNPTSESSLFWSIYPS
ncbi:MAG TPA: rod-binding protein [Pseudobdellovibrionaceae bacterium]|jgi:flagellar protein FlgJ|nr:rod-binding protein [Pseudobdellovibrionaceae bacterium]